MEAVKRKSARRAATPLLGDWDPLPALWSGRAPRFATEHSARFYIRTHHAALAAAGALAVHTGRLYVHRERFPQAVERLAVDAACKGLASQHE